MSLRQTRLPSESEAADTGSTAQPNFTAIKADFVPGERTIFADDFSDMTGDEPPPHWKIRGATPELRVAGNIRELAFIGDSYDIYPNLNGLPRNFTMEMDLHIEKFSGQTEQNFLFLGKDGRTEVLKLAILVDNPADPGSKDRGKYSWRIGVGTEKEHLGDKSLLTNWDQLVKLALWVQNGRIRVYVNGERIFDFNQVEIGDIASLHLNYWVRNTTLLFQRVRFAECAPDFGQTIASSGKFVTHGILFDSDSDRIKPESAAIIQSIARGLTAHPDLKVEIDGHTDATGTPTHNMDLSKRRAEAVKNVLVAQFSVEAGRLTTIGYGSSKPLDSSNTPQGKAQNRRVEFVRQ